MTETTAPTRSLGERHAMLADDRTAAWLGLEVQDVSDGHAVITMTLRPEMLNGFGIAHGGMIFSLADTAFAMACNPADGSAETITVASGADINFVGSGTAGRVLTAIADRRQQAGRSGVYDVQVHQALPDGGTEVIAEFRGRSRTVRRP